MAWNVKYAPTPVNDSLLSPLAALLALTGYAPSVSIGAGGNTLVITPAAPPDAVVGTPWEVLFISTGTGPWTWTKASGDAWMTIGSSTGLASGTPITPGPDPTVINVVDSLGATGTLTF